MSSFYFKKIPQFVTKAIPSVVWHLDRSEPKIALTFDDGPHPDVTPWVLDLLDEKEIKATFFLVGENVYDFVDIYRTIAKRGHTIGSHTYSHANAWKMKGALYMQDVEKCAKLLDTKKFRPPYGKLTLPTNILLRQNKYKVFMYDVLSGDFDPSLSKEQILMNTLENTQNGSIVVWHDTLKCQRNLEYALPRYIDICKAQGFEFVTL